MSKCSSFWKRWKTSSSFEISMSMKSMSFNS